MNLRSAALGASIGVFLISIVYPATSHAQSRAIVEESDKTNNMGSASESTGDAASTSIPRRQDRYQIHRSDTLSLTFERTPEFNQTITVQPDGYIVLRSVGGLLAAGQTLPELTQSVKTAYSRILHDPVISIDLREFEKPYFVVGGQVQKPGKFDWRGEVTLTEAIAMAGGFSEAAKHSQVLMFRRISDQWTQAKIINVKKMLSSRDLQEDPLLQPGDMLYVPKNAISKIKPYLPTFSTGAYIPY